MEKVDEELERLLGWFVKDRKEIKETLGFAHLSVFQWDEPSPNFGFQFVRNPPPENERTMDGRPFTF